MNRGTEGDNGNTSADANVNANANANADANASTHIAAAVPPPPHLFDATRAPILVIRATIELLDETPETVLQILNHLYPHLALQLSPANWQPVWRLADKLGLTALSALCTEYMQDNILHVDPLAVVTWAKRTSQAEWYRKSSEIILDRMASSDALTLETLPRSLHVDVSVPRVSNMRGGRTLTTLLCARHSKLLNEFAYLAHNLHKFTSQGTQIIAETATYTGVRHAWHNAVKEASANPTTMSRESLLEVAASVPQAVSPRLATLVEKFRPVSLPWRGCLTGDVASARRHLKSLYSPLLVRLVHRPTRAETQRRRLSRGQQRRRGRWRGRQ